MASNGINVTSTTKNLYMVHTGGYGSGVYLSKSYAVSVAKRMVPKAKGPVTVIEGEIVWGGVVEDLPEEITMHNLMALGSGWEPPEKFPMFSECTRIEKVKSKWYGYYFDNLIGVTKTRNEIESAIRENYYADNRTWRELQEG